MNRGTILRSFKWGKIMFGMHPHEWYILHIWHQHIHFLFVTSPSGQLDVYIKNLERVLDAIDFFNQNNPNCLELSNLVSVLFWIIFHFNMSTFLPRKTLVLSRFRGSWFKSACIFGRRVWKEGGITERLTSENVKRH